MSSICKAFSNNIVLSKKIKKNPTIGFFINNLYHQYEIGILEGVNKFASEYNYNVLSYVGGSFNNPYYDTQGKNNVFKLADIKSLDGIISATTSIGTHANLKDLNNIYEQFSDIPLVSIGVPLKNSHTVSVNNETGLSELMRHLIEDHGYHNIAFIHGPVNNVDSVTRFTAYKKMLEKCSLQFREELVVYSEFHRDINSAKKVISELLDERKVSFDAMICTNDYNAVEFIKELNNRNIKVPDDIAVVGFDNITECQYNDPPLTTVNQPMYELGFQAGQMLHSILSGKKNSKFKEINSSLIIRNSCGCTNKSGENKKLTARIEKYLVRKNVSLKEKLLFKIVEKMSEQFNDQVKNIQLYRWAKKLLSFFNNDVSMNSEEEFIQYIKRLIYNGILYNVDISSWNASAFYFFIEIMPYFKMTDKSDFITNLFIKVTKVIQDIKEKHLTHSKILVSQFEMKLFLIKKRLGKIKSLVDLENIVHKDFSSFGIKSCYIVIFKNSNNVIDKQYARIIAAYKNHKKIKLNNNYFNTNMIIPCGLKNHIFDNTHFIYSLNKNNKDFGYIIYELAGSEKSDEYKICTELGRFYENLTFELEFVLKKIIFNKNRKKKSKKNTNFKYFLSENTARKYFQEITEYIEKEKVYLDHNLSLYDLSKQMNISRNYISYVINFFSNGNFFSFINKYRVYESEKYLKDPVNYSILDAAYESGFRNKSTFNKFFKLFKNMTPSQFRNEYKS